MEILLLQPASGLVNQFQFLQPFAFQDDIEDAVAVAPNRPHLPHLRHIKPPHIGRVQLSAVLPAASCHERRRSGPRQRFQSAVRFR